jgi:hypothetical protein
MGHTIVQVGDMLQYLTGGYLRSAVHRIEPSPARPAGADTPAHCSSTHAPTSTYGRTNAGKPTR